MTTSLVHNCINHEPSFGTTENFKNEVKAVLTELAPRYIDSVDTMGEYMLRYLHDSLLYWASVPTAKASLARKYRRTKIVEWFAFWTGYSFAGGKFPPKSTKIHFPTSRNILKVPKNRKIFSVIPIGSESNELREILLNTLNILQTHDQIAKIYCVHDGVNPCENLEGKFPKVETLTTVKRSGPAKARNIGIIEGFKHACSAALLLDNDVSLTTDSLNGLLQSYNQNSSAIACPFIYSAGQTWLDHYHELSGTLNGRYLPDNQHLFFGTTSCMLISEEVHNAGLLFSYEFPEAAGEDIDYCLRAIFEGFQISALDHVIVTHWYGYNADNLHDWNLFQSRFERYGRGEYRLCQKHPYYHFLVNYTRERLCLSQDSLQA